MATKTVKRAIPEGRPGTGVSMGNVKTAFPSRGEGKVGTDAKRSVKPAITAPRPGKNVRASGKVRKALSR